MIEPDEALTRVLQAADRRPSELVPPELACGLELAEPVLADRDYPPFERAMMDGYAVRLCDAGRSVTVAGEVPAGNVSGTEVVAEQCLAIMTGALCPPGTEAVVPKECACREGSQVRLPRIIAPGQHIAGQGSECPRGRLVLRPGETITPLGVAVMASFGIRLVRVTPKPTLGIVTTGSELVPPGVEPAAGQIRDSNGPMLVAMARDFGLGLAPRIHADDQLPDIVAAMETFADCDVILLSGGVSVGDYDLVPQALDAYGARVIFHKVRQKPGKPLLFARKGRQLIFGLPGNPLACHFCFHRYVAAAIRKMGEKPPVPDAGTGELDRPIQPKAGRTYFVPALAVPGAEAARKRLEPLPGTSSADIFGACRANCYVEVPPGRIEVGAGCCLRFSWIGRAPWPN